MLIIAQTNCFKDFFLSFHLTYQIFFYKMLFISVLKDLNCQNMYEIISFDWVLACFIIQFDLWKKGLGIKLTHYGILFYLKNDKGVN
jgi:hypothetical protein